MTGCSAPRFIFSRTFSSLVFASSQIGSNSVSFSVGVSKNADELISKQKNCSRKMNGMQRYQVFYQQNSALKFSAFFDVHRAKFFLLEHKLRLITFMDCDRDMLEGI